MNSIFAEKKEVDYCNDVESCPSDKFYCVKWEIFKCGFNYKIYL